MTNEELYERANTAITELFNDNSVSAHKCVENLESLIGEMQVMIDSLDV